MNLKSARCCGFLGLALLVVVDVALGAWVDAVLFWVALLSLGNGVCVEVLGPADRVPVGGRLVGDLGATEMHSLRSW
jgi:hypothetical protein